MRLSPLFRGAGDRPVCLCLLVDHLDSPTRPAAVAANRRPTPPRGVDECLAASTTRRFARWLKLLEPLREPAHSRPVVRAEPSVRLLDEVSIEPHETQLVNEQLDVERRHIVGI